MNGQVSLRSVAGKGSEFRVDIPVVAATEQDILGIAPDTGQVVALMPGQGTFRILIAEDQEENILLLQRLLETVGFQTQVARNGQEAVERFADWRPHFIWMDCRMPVMDGMEATRRIRRMEGGDAVKIVALTASVFREERDEVIACGMDDFLRKPYRPDEIYGCMAKYLAVRYEYADGAHHAEQPMELQRVKELVCKLPPKLRQELRSALLSLRKSDITAALDRIAETHPATAEPLRRQAEELAFTLMLDELNWAENEKN
jgi:CheY-like chemotaxis protein